MNKVSGKVYDRDYEEFLLVDLKKKMSKLSYFVKAPASITSN